MITRPVPVLDALHKLGVEVILNERLVLSSLGGANSSTQERVVKTTSGREISARLVVSTQYKLLCRILTLYPADCAATLYRSKAQYGIDQRGSPGVHHPQRTKGWCNSCNSDTADSYCRS